MVIQGPLAVVSVPLSVLHQALCPGHHTANTRTVWSRQPIVHCGRPCAEPAEGPGGGGNRARPVPAVSRSSRGWRRVWAGREGLCLTSPSVRVTVRNITAVSWQTVIVGLVLSLGPADGQRGRVPWAGAREPVRDPWGPLTIFINDLHRALARLLLVPVSIFFIQQVPWAGDLGRLSQGHWHWSRLGQFIGDHGAWKRGGRGDEKEGPLPRASHPTALPGLRSGFGAGPAQGPVWPEPAGRAGGAAPVQRVRRGSRRGVQAMVDAPRALPLSPQQRWGLWALLFSEGTSSCKCPSCPSWPGDRPPAEQRAAGLQERSLLGPASQVPRLSLGWVRKPALPQLFHTSYVWSWGPLCVWETHRSPLWGRGHVEGWALLEVGAEGTVVLLLWEPGFQHQTRWHWSHSSGRIFTIFL